MGDRRFINIRRESARDRVFMPESVYLGTGTANANKFLRGDRRWADISGLPSALAITFVSGGSTGHAWNAMPLAEALLFGSSTHILQTDLTNYSECRLIVNQQTNGVGGAILELQYHTSFTTTAATYSPIGTSVVQAVLSTGNPAIRATAWIPLVAAARADVFIAVIGSGGDGVLSPQFGQIVAQFK